MSVTRVLVFERATKRYARFRDPERDAPPHYVPIDDWIGLGRPEFIENEFRAVKAHLTVAA